MVTWRVKISTARSSCCLASSAWFKVDVAAASAASAALCACSAFVTCTGQSTPQTECQPTENSIVRLVVSS